MQAPEDISLESPLGGFPAVEPNSETSMPAPTEAAHDHSDNEDSKGAADTNTVADTSVAAEIPATTISEASSAAAVPAASAAQTSQAPVQRASSEPPSSQAPVQRASSEPPSSQAPVQHASSEPPSSQAPVQHASSEPPPRLPLPPRLDFAPLPSHAQQAPPPSEPAQDGSGSPDGGSKRRSSIVVAFAKGVGNRLGLRQKGAAGEAGDAEHVQDAAGAPPAEAAAAGAQDDSPRRRRPSVTARQPVGAEAEAAPPALPSTAPSTDAQGDPLHIEGAQFVSDAQGGNFKSSPTFQGRRPPNSAPRQGSLQDCT